MTRDNGVLAAGVISLAAVLLMILAGLWATTDGFAAWATPGGGGGSTLTAQDDGIPLAGTVVAVNAGVDIDATLTAGVLTINNTRPTATPIPPVATATPQPTATPGAAGFTKNQGLPLDSAATPTSSDFSGIPNVYLEGTGNWFPVAADTYYDPFYVEQEININRISLEATDTNPAQDCSVGIYEVTEQWQPATLEVDFSPLTLAGGVAGWNHKTVNHNLPAGSYLAAFQCNGRGLGAFVAVTDITMTMENTTSFSTKLTRWQATAPSIGPATPFPNSPAAGDLWDSYTVQGTADNTFYTLRFRWTVNP